MRTIKDNIKEAIGRSLDAYNKKFGKAIHDRIDNIVAQAGTDNTEIVDARVDSSGKIHTTLNNRINEEFKKGKEHMQSVSGSHLNLDGTMESYLQNIEIEGNTIQNPNNLADIKSVGDKVEGQELYRIPIKCIKANGNLLNTKEFINKKIIDHLGNEVSNTIDWYITPFIRIVGKILNLLGMPNTKVSNGTTLFVCYYTKTREFITSQSIIA